jgi:hypothetical protein
MRRWLRLTLPPDAWLGVFALAYLVLEFVPRALGANSHAGDGVVNMAIVGYAAYRVVAFHPIFLPDYRNWLATTPWTARLPLPVGPVHLVPQDVIIVGLLAGLAHQQHPALGILPLVLKFLLVYELFMTASFAVLHMPWFAYLLGFGLGLLCLVWNSTIVALEVSVALYLIALFGLRKALVNFASWNPEWMAEEHFQPRSLEKMVERMKQNILGWPFDNIRAKDVAASISYRDGILLSLLAGWWMFVVLRRVGGGGNLEPVYVLIGGISQFAVLGRLGTYCWGYLPPISIWGRIFTLRWIIPGYDHVFLAPLAGMLVTVFGIAAAHQWAVPVDAAAPAILALMWMTTLNLGPSLKRWRLTGKHRMSPAMLMMNSQSEVKQL